MKSYILVLVAFVLNNPSVLCVPVEEDLTITAKEKYALDEFKPQVVAFLPHDYMKSDIFLIKFLRASNLNLKMSKQMILDMLVWRDQNQIDSILEEDFSDIELEYPVTADAVDYEMRPVGTADVSQWDVRKALVTGKKDKVLRYVYRLAEMGAHRIYDAQRRGLNVTQGTTILNLKGFNLIQHACPQCIPIYINLVMTFERFYPGMAHKIVLINTPPSFGIIITALLPVMSKESKEALVIFGNDKHKWQKFILSMIHPNQIESQFGGTKVY